ncbi:hypothetical protein BCR22_09630 [Enterococcus plantarum]|nr:hypothetical protein BCR22_09630 [Enterococcus plantarum]
MNKHLFFGSFLRSIFSKQREILCRFNDYFTSDNYAIGQELMEYQHSYQANKSKKVSWLFI